MTGLSDSFSRPINYLRLSVTDRCNLRCRYCLPEKGISLLPRHQILSFEEFSTIAKIAAELGITKLRLTGGEPLVREDLPRLVEMLSKIEAITDLSLTTNGVLLGRYADELKQAGLKRVNISLDSLKPAKFHFITRRSQLKQVFGGIEAALKADLRPVKINIVALRGVNDDEVIDFANKTISDGWNIRFIELMPFNRDAPFSTQFMPASEIKQRLLAHFGSLESSTIPVGNGPAQYFRLPGAAGTVGFITPISQHFCINCNRLRLTASGRLRPCLFSDEEIDLQSSLRNGASIEQIKQLIQVAIQNKPYCHQLAQGATAKTAMAQLGG